MLARGERRLGERDVKMVRRADVDDVHVRRLDEFLGRSERALGAERGRGAACMLRRRRGNTDEAGACEPGGARMNGTDEPGPCDGNTNTS